jgi:hypothetical protein
VWRYRVGMGSFGQAIPVTGPNALEPKEQVWFNEVRIFKSTKNGDVTYHVHYLHPNNGDEIDDAVRAALQTAVQQLTAKASHIGRT